MTKAIGFPSICSFIGLFFFSLHHTSCKVKCKDSSSSVAEFLKAKEGTSFLTFFSTFSHVLSSTLIRWVAFGKSLSTSQCPGAKKTKQTNKWEREREEKEKNLSLPHIFVPWFPKISFLWSELFCHTPCTWCHISTPKFPVGIARTDHYFGCR